MAEVQVPTSFPEQKAIAHILGSLDDKIELNRRMNATLEGMAQALFKSWFVDFDPVLDNAILAGNPIPDQFTERAKVRRRILEQNQNDECSVMSDELKDSKIQNSEFITHHSPQALPQKGSIDHPTLSDPKSLFPNSFTETSFGFVPNGYTSETIEDLCSFVSRGVTPKYEEGSGRFIINQKVNRGTELDLSNLKELQPDLPVPEGKHALKYDVLVNCLGEGTLGRVHFYGGESGLYAVDQHMTICRAKSPELAAYIYHYLASPEGQDRIEASKTGSTGMTMFNIKKVRAFDVPMPTGECVKAFGKEVLDLSQKVEVNRRQSVILTKLRDTLLPKLISGELRLPESQQLTEDAIA